MLQEAFKRIHLPPSFTSLVSNCFLSRYNQFFTAYGNTDEYHVLSGIDQGEIISPILWCIYYDPLLCHIQQSSYGYRQQIVWNTDPTKDSPVVISEHTPTLAYMDDTFWIAKSRLDLEHIIDSANSFY